MVSETLRGSRWMIRRPSELVPMIHLKVVVCRMVSEVDSGCNASMDVSWVRESDGNLYRFAIFEVRTIENVTYI
jgi:hypothetical protein